MSEAAVHSEVKELTVLWLHRLDNNSNINGNNRNLNNNNTVRGMTSTETIMKTYSNLYPELCSFNNLLLAYKKCRKRKTKKKYTQDFDKDLVNNLYKLQEELLNKTYQPKPLVDFTIRDPKTRKISKSDFRDRIVHHALCNIIEPIFDNKFINDSYANRIGKGSLKAIERFEKFKRIVSKNNTKSCCVLKADIKHYFDTVNHDILINIIQDKICDNDVIHLIGIILKNQNRQNHRGMPLGNLTSQFFANIYLNELDQYIKHNLRIKYYIRYVDDFVILHNSRMQLEQYRNEIDAFLKNHLKIELHPDKTQIYKLNHGIGFLGLRIFYNHKLLRKNNIRKFKKRLKKTCEQYDNKEIDYDVLYDLMEGWSAYSKNADTYNLRNNILNPLDQRFGGEISTKEYNRQRRKEKKQKYLDAQKEKIKTTFKKSNNSPV